MSCMFPFLFLNVTRSRWLQIATIFLRWIGFLLMILISLHRIFVLHHQTSFSLNKTYENLNPNLQTLNNYGSIIPDPPVLCWSKIFNLFGISVYVFMCHHSLPGLVTAIENKSNLLIRVFLPTYLCVFFLNICLSVTTIFAFNEVEDLITLNFIPNDRCVDVCFLVVLAKFIGYFLSLFPVLILVSTFPIVETTLLNNIRLLFLFFSFFQGDRGQSILKYILPVTVILPPFLISMFTSNIGFLVGFTGAVFGSGIQYIIPAVLVYKCRKTVNELVRSNFDDFEGSIGSNMLTDLTEDGQSVDSMHTSTMGSTDLIYKNKSNVQIFGLSLHASPFQHVFWIVIILIWSILCSLFVVVDKIYSI